MAYHLFGNNPLSEPMMVYCQIDLKEHISMKFYLKFKSFHSRKCIWKCCLPKCSPLLNTKDTRITPVLNPSITQFYPNDIDGIVQYCSNSSALAIELHQSRNKPVIYSGTCVKRLGKSYQKHKNFIICLARSLQNNVCSPCRERPPVLRG